MKIAFVRHGETEFNADATRIGGRSNFLPLTEKGKAQALECGCEIAKGNIRFRRILCSPALRTRQTLELILEGCPSLKVLPCEFVDELQELSRGEWEGRPIAEIITPQQARIMEADAWNFAAPGGESQKQVALRMKSVVDRLYEEHTDEDVLVVGHGNAIKCLLCLLTGSDPVDSVKMVLGNCHGCLIGFEGGWKLLDFNRKMCDFQGVPQEGSYCSYNYIADIANGEANAFWKPEGDMSAGVDGCAQGRINARGKLVKACLDMGEDSRTVPLEKKRYPTTAFDWYNFVAQDVNSDALIQLVLRFEGRLDYKVLRRAFVCCVVEEPLLSSVFRVDDKAPVWEQGVVPLDLLCREIDAQDVDGAVRGFLAERLDATEVMPVMVALVHGGVGDGLVSGGVDDVMGDGGSGDVLVVKVHHALCDGMASVQFLKMLSEYYTSLYMREDFLPVEKPLLRDSREFYKYFGLATEEEKASRMDMSLLEDMTPTWGTPVGDNSVPQEYEYQMVQIGQAGLSGIRSFAAANGSSLNAVLTAAYHRALAKVVGISNDTAGGADGVAVDGVAVAVAAVAVAVDAVAVDGVAVDGVAAGGGAASGATDSGSVVADSLSYKEIQFTVNLRQFSPEGTCYSLCNFSNIFNIQLPVSGDFASVAREADRAIREAIQPEKVLQTVLVSEAMSTDFAALKEYYGQDWANVKVSGMCTPMISNLGLLTTDPLSFGECAASQIYVVPPAFVGPSFMLSVSTYNGVMTLCVAYQNPSTTDGFVREVLSEMHQILLQCCAL